MSSRRAEDALKHSSMLQPKLAKLSHDVFLNSMLEKLTYRELFDFIRERSESDVQLANGKLWRRLQDKIERLTTTC